MEMAAFLGQNALCVAAVGDRISTSLLGAAGRQARSSTTIGHQQLNGRLAVFIHLLSEATSRSKPAAWLNWAYRRACEAACVLSLVKTAASNVTLTMWGLPLCEDPEDCPYSGPAVPDPNPFRSMVFAGRQRRSMAWLKA